MHYTQHPATLWPLCGGQLRKVVEVRNQGLKKSKIRASKLQLRMKESNTSEDCREVGNQRQSQQFEICNFKKVGHQCDPEIFDRFSAFWGGCFDAQRILFEPLVISLIVNSYNR